MIRVLFVCLGNICRSPMGEFILKDMVQKRGIADRFFIASAGTEDYNDGDPVYPPAARKLRDNGIACSGHHARGIRKNDYEEFDYILAMDGQNIRNMTAFWGGDPEGKIRLLLDYTDEPRSVADPWYTGNFDAAYDDIYRGCEAFLDKTMKKSR